MSESSTTILRRMLDERSIKHFDYSKSGWSQTQWEAPDGNRHFTYETYNNPAKTAKLVISWFPTPEQAIAATLGNGECENVAPDYLDFLCSVCGFVHYHSDENDTGDGNDWAYCPRCGKAVER